MTPETKKPFPWNKWLCLASIGAWLGVVFGVEPMAGWWVWLVFYGSLGMGFFAGVGWFGELFVREENEYFIRYRFRRWGLLSAFFIVGVVLLQQFRVLLWWVGLLWLAFVLLLELILYHGETRS